ncbi:hypothetical protein G7Y79_00024g055070 [Physcia stellaris]|nr:hypothetical protein G7Y79_00024g055070 [Physcia stellaris]
MHPPTLLPLLLVLITPTNAAPRIATVGTSLTTTTVDSLSIGGDKMGAAAFYGADDYTFIAYQANDTSIHLLSGNGPPTTSSTYSDRVILAAQLARNDTPLAVAVDYGNPPGEAPWNTAHIFYHSATPCTSGSGNYIHQLCMYGNPGASGKWTTGSLNAEQVCASETSNLLYALGDPRGQKGPVRVGIKGGMGDEEEEGVVPIAKVWVYRLERSLV